MTKVLDMRHSVEEAVAAAEKPLLPQGISQLRSSYYWYSTVGSASHTTEEELY